MKYVQKYSTRLAPVRQRVRSRKREEDRKKETERKKREYPSQMLEIKLYIFSILFLRPTKYRAISLTASSEE